MPFVDTALKPFQLAVFIGRFQPFHRGHLSVVENALDSADHLVILLGSCDKPRDTYNPFTFDERKRMIISCLSADDRARVLILPLVDYTYNDEKWVVQVQSKVTEAREHFGLRMNAKIALIGHSKDNTSFYLKMFPQWASVNVPGYRTDKDVISATDIRSTFFSASAVLDRIETIMPDLPKTVADQMLEFSASQTYHDLIEEFDFVRKYKEPFKALPYPPIFVTVDAVVVQSGHVLLVKRRARPGKGLWAMPGGFLNAGERIDNAVIRELREETKIKVPDAVLRGSLIEKKVFDDPHRSARGRTITHAFYFKLRDDVELPKVKGADDAEKAQWVPIADLRRDQLFEDHYSILEDFLG